MIIKEALKMGMRILRNQLEVEILLACATGFSREKIFAHPEIPLTEKAKKRFLNDFVARRGRGEPIAYITGHKEFFGLDFYVDKKVLIPRPETELLVEEVIEVCEKLNKPARILDIGTGSGCIAISLAKNLLLVNITAVDVSGAVLELAKRNCTTHKVKGRVKLLKSDLLSSVKDRGFYVIVANLPYIGDSEKHTVDREVLNYEPHSALFSGQSGLELYDKLFSQIKSMKNKPYCLVAEIGVGQKRKITALIKKRFGNKPVMWKNDLAGIPRVFTLYV